MTKVITDRGERFALHSFGKQSIIPGASAAARAVFEACGGAVGWRSWVAPAGTMIKMSLVVMARFLDDHPDAPAEAVYNHMMSFPGGEKHNIWDDKTLPWDDAPMSVRGAYETFRGVYLHLWFLVRTHDDTMARSLPPRPLPRLVHHGRRNVVPLPAPHALDDVAGDESPDGDEAA